MVRVRSVGVMVVAVLAVAGCDGGGSTSPSPSAVASTDAADSPALSSSSPTPAPAPSPTPTPTPELDVAAEAVDRLVGSFNAIYGVAEGVTDAPDDVDATIDAATVEESAARTFLRDQLAIALTEGVQLRGDAVGAPSGEASTSVSGSTTSFAVDACVSVRTRNAVEGGLDEPMLTADGTYRTYPLEGVVSDDGVRLTRAFPDDGVELPTCIPMNIEQPALQSWESFNEANVAYQADTSDEDARAELAEWVDGDSDLLAEFDTRLILDETQTEPVVETARRDELQLSWCQDPSQNSNAIVIEADGSTRPLKNIVFRSSWQRDEGVWTMATVSSFTQDRRDDVAALWERCFGG